MLTTATFLFFLRFPVRLAFWLLGRYGRYKAEQVWLNVYRVNGPLCRGRRLFRRPQKNIYLALHNDKKVTVIDPGFQVPLPGLAKTLASVGRQLQEVTVILCTHYHVGNTGGVKALAEATGARVYAHPEDIPYLTGKLAHAFPQTGLIRRIIFRLLLTLPNPWYYPQVKAITRGELVHGLSDFRVLETPGHTPGSISFFNDKQGVVFTGDALQSRPSPTTMDPEQAAQSIDTIAKLPVRTVLPADGKPILDQTQIWLQTFRHFNLHVPPLGGHAWHAKT